MKTVSPKHEQNNIEIARATSQDVPTMYKWGRANWELWGNEKDGWYTKKSLELWVTHPRYDVLLIARKGKKRIGMCTTHTLHDWAICDGLFVHPDFRGFGIGKQLLDATITILKNRGISDLSLLAELDNKKAIHFYKKLGFSRGYKFLWMNKKITGKNK
ncbi:MAG: GNAT family N-acetyltransferase [Patescibacteria group bacterium]